MPSPARTGRPGLRVHVGRFRVSPLVNQAALFLPLNYVYSAETLFTAADRRRRARRLAGLGVVAPRISEWSKVRLTPPWIHHAPHRPRTEIRRCDSQHASFCAVARAASAPAVESR